MSREKLKWRPHKSESTDAGHRGGTTRSSNELSVMERKPRGCIVQSYWMANQVIIIYWEKPEIKTRLFNSWTIRAG